MDDFGKWSFFVKPKWFHGGLKFINLKPPLTLGCFKRFWRFFLGKVSSSKTDQILAKIRHMLGFTLNLLALKGLKLYI